MRANQAQRPTNVRAERFDIARDERRDIGVQHGRARALVLAVGGIDVAGEIDELRDGAQSRAGALFVRGIGVGVEETDGDRLRLLLCHGARNARDLRVL